MPWERKKRKRALTTRKGQWRSARRLGLDAFRAPSPRTVIGQGQNSRVPALDPIYGVKHSGGDATQECMPLALARKSAATDRLRERGLALCCSRGLNSESARTVFGLPNAIIWMYVARDNLQTRITYAECVAVMVWRKLRQGAGAEILLLAAVETGHKLKGLGLGRSLAQQLLLTQQGPHFLHASTDRAVGFWGAPGLGFECEIAGGQRRAQANARGMHDPGYVGGAFMWKAVASGKGDSE
jgi:hypothetical protein